MKCIVKGCKNEAVKQNLCREHYDPEQPAADEITAAAARTIMPVGQRASLLMHSALLVSGKIAGSLVHGYRRLFSISSNERAQILDQVAKANFKKGRRSKSLDALKLAVRTDPENPMAQLKLGEFYLTSGEYEKACQSLGKALELAPDSVEICQALGEAYYHREEYKSALKFLKKGHKLSPENEKLNYLIGLTHDKLGSQQDAIKFLQIVIDMNPRCVEYYYSLGFAYESSGNKDEALLNFKKAIELERTKTS